MGFFGGHFLLVCCSVERDVTSTYPDVELRTLILLALKHLWGSIGGTSTVCRQGLASIVEIPKSKV